MFCLKALICLLAVFGTSFIDAADDPEELGYYYRPSSFDGRDHFTDCLYFFRQVARSSFGCGDCWAQSSAQQLGTALCIVGLAPPDPLSSFDIITCTDGIGNRCEGQSWGFQERVYRMGATTGSNAPRVFNDECKRYPFLLCDRADPDVHPDCPNIENPFGRFKGITKGSNCSDFCEDGSPVVRYGANSYPVQIYQRGRPVGPYIADIKDAIITNGTVIASYFCGADYRDLQGCGDNCPTITRNEEGFHGSEENHIVELIGWEEEETADGVMSVWIVKNPSAGTTFGRGGFFKVRLGYNINGIEGRVYGINNNEWTNCHPRPYREVIYEEIHGIRKRCKGRGRRCPVGCIPENSKWKMIEFDCKANGSPTSTIEKEMPYHLSCKVQKTTEPDEED